MVSWAHRNAVPGGHLDNKCSNALVLTALGEDVTYGTQGGLMGSVQVFTGHRSAGLSGYSINRYSTC